MIEFCGVFSDFFFNCIHFICSSYIGILVGCTVLLGTLFSFVYALSRRY